MIALLVGTRPEIIKMAPVIRELTLRKVPFLFIHSNQHYSAEMDAVILKDLNLPQPDINLHVGSGTHATQTSKVMLGVEEVCLKYKPDLILVHGDTNTTFSGALAAKKMHVKVGHIEAGLRSFDTEMPEEINRILTDRISDIMFAPTTSAKENLLKEGFPGADIVVTGNTIVDALKQHLPLAEKSQILEKRELESSQYILLTLHRAENTDDPVRFAKMIELVKHAHAVLGVPILWPVHPRTQAILIQSNIELPKYVQLVPPLGYIDMLKAMSNAQLIMTDSGGLQEEAYILHKPVVTLRTSTERPETLSANFIIDSDTAKFDQAWKAFQKGKVSWSDSLGTGQAAEKIVSRLQSFIGKNKPMKKHPPTVSVLGLGYIGLPTALLLAKNDVYVSGFDVNLRRVELLQQGVLPFQENGLDELMSEVVEKKTFSPVSELQSSEFYIVSVPTPQIKGTADLKYVVKALSLIKAVFKAGQTIIIESTIGPRDCVDVLIPMVEKWKIPFHFAHCPERAIPGNTLYEMVHNDRIVGGDTPQSAKKVSTLYRKFVQSPLYETNTVVAASCKVMENTYRAVNIALANEFAQLAEELDFDVWEAIELANKHPRVRIHQPGPGVGGHCIPIDPWFFVGSSQHSQLIKRALKKNEEMAEYICDQVEAKIKQLKIKKPVIGILGYAYKKNVDDARETPAEHLRKILVKKYKVLVTDPYVRNELIEEQKKVLEEANVWIVATDHDSYQKLKLNAYPQLRFLYDSRNVITESQVKKFQGEFNRLGQNSK